MRIRRSVFRTRPKGNRPVPRRSRVVDGIRAGRSLRWLARNTHVSLRTIQRDVRLQNQTDSVRSIPRVGRPRSITPAVRGRIRAKMRARTRPSVRHLRKQLEAEHIVLSLGSVNNALHDCGFRSVRPQRRPMLTSAHKAARLAWATTHVNDSTEDVNRRVYSDEKLFIAGHRSRRVWIRDVDPIPPKPTSK